MKQIVRFITLVICVCILSSLLGCADASFFPPIGGVVEGEGEGAGSENQGEEGAGNNQTKPEDDDPDHKKGEFTVKFYLGAKSVTHRYDYGETVEPPQTIETYKTARVNYVFDGWDGVEFKPVTENTSYHANYKMEYNYYTATFVMGTEKVEVKTICEDAPTVPDPIDIEGAEFVCWDKQAQSATSDTTYTAIYTTLYSAEIFQKMYKYTLLSYPTKTTESDNKSGTTEEALVLCGLIYEQYNNPQEPVAYRIVEHLNQCVKEEIAPMFNACCNWNYAPHTGAIAMAKANPSIWNKVPASTKLRLDTMMKAFAYLESFATSDFNNYGTGPSLTGNYGKNWNPNYRLANVPVMVYVTHYFGNGDMVEGEKTLNTLLKGFDEKEYTTMVNSFSKYGWRRAVWCWTRDGLTSTDGKNNKGNGSKDLLIKGGPAVGDDTSTASDLLVALGTGVGVGNGGKDYLYKGYSLSEADGIVRSLLMNNYGSGDLSKGKDPSSTFLEVKSDHWYDITGDKVKEKVAWILPGADGLEVHSPFEGQYGMMKEFASGNRSSTGYCSHDFVLTTNMIYNCRLLNIYDVLEDEFVDRNGTSILDAIYVGNEDFLFKNEKGYKGYATGSYGESSKSHSEANEGVDYFMLKYLWRNTLLEQFHPVEQQ